MSLTLNYLNAQSLPNYTTLLALENRHPIDPRDIHEFQPTTKPVYVVLGEQLAKTSLFKLASRIASSFYAHLPSFSLPLAEASQDLTCPIPKGSYLASCNNPVLMYSPLENQCELTTRCATIYEGLPHQPTSFRFNPYTQIDLENLNGTLSVTNSSKNTEEMSLSTSGESSEISDDQQAPIIEDLPPGSVIGLTDNSDPTLISPEKLDTYSPELTAYQRLAKHTGGIMGYLPLGESLNTLMHKISDHILKAAEASPLIDIAFVLDTTSSMSPHITEVKNHLVEFLEQLQERKKGEKGTCRVAVVEYRDTGDYFLNRVTVTFTPNFTDAAYRIKGLVTGGGGDAPEAALDALVTAQRDLPWNRNPDAKRVAMLISDAAPHPITVDGRYNEDDIIREYTKAGTKITVYPIFADS